MEIKVEDVNSIDKQIYENAEVAIQKLEKCDSVYLVGVNVDTSKMDYNSAFRRLECICDCFKAKDLHVIAYLIRDGKPDLDIKKLTKNI
jgi:hypothetical protein